MSILEKASWVILMFCGIRDQPDQAYLFQVCTSQNLPFPPSHLNWQVTWPLSCWVFGSEFFFNKDSYSLKSNKNSKFENHWIRWPPFQAQHFSHWDIASSLSSSDPHPFLLLSRWQYWDRQMSPHHINKEAPWCSLNLAGLGLWFFCWWKLIKLFASSEYHTGSQGPRTPCLSESLVGLITHGLGFLRPPHEGHLRASSQGTEGLRTLGTSLAPSL